MQESTGKIFEIESDEQQKKLELELGEKLLNLEQDALEILKMSNRKQRRHFVSLVRSGMSQTEAARQANQKE